MPNGQKSACQLKKSGSGPLAAAMKQGNTLGATKSQATNCAGMALATIWALAIVIQQAQWVRTRKEIRGMVSKIWLEISGSGLQALLKVIQKIESTVGAVGTSAPPRSFVRRIATTIRLRIAAATSVSAA